MSSMIETRHSTHGDFRKTLKLTWELYRLYSSARSTPASDGHETAIFNICQKLARIACGSPIPDHYDDIAGYAELAKALAEQPLKVPPCPSCGKFRDISQVGKSIAYCPNCAGWYCMRCTGARAMKQNSAGQIFCSKCGQL